MVRREMNIDGGVYQMMYYRERDEHVKDLHDLCVAERMLKLIFDTGYVCPESFKRGGCKEECEACLKQRAETEVTKEGL
jgi:hypothetical protein